MSECAYHHTLNCADCPAGCKGTDESCKSTIGDNWGWKDETEALKKHLEGCLDIYENNLWLAPITAIRYRRLMKENIKRVKVALAEFSKGRTHGKA